MTTLAGCAFCGVVSNKNSATNLLAKIQMNKEVFKFGDPTTSNGAGRRKDIAEFKSSADSSMFQKQMLEFLHPLACQNHPHFIANCIQEKHPGCKDTWKQ